ncbi:MAG: hypothetical protein ACJ790_08300 [Myxococcaceae bacterium]
MNTKNTILTAITLLSTAVPGLALADGFRVHASVNLPPVTVSMNTPPCDHEVTPVPPPGNSGYQQQAPGHYELRTVNEFVPGRYDQVWVPASCTYQRWGHWGHHGRQVCSPGYYTQQWIPGRYVETSKYVFVSDQPTYQYYGNGEQYSGGGYAGQR